MLQRFVGEGPIGKVIMFMKWQVMAHSERIKYWLKVLAFFLLLRAFRECIINRWKPISKVERLIEKKEVSHLILGDFLVFGFFKGRFDNWLDSYFITSMNPHKPEEMYNFA